MDLKNKVALVTVGSAGIGRAIAQNLIQAGAHVAITGHWRSSIAGSGKSGGAIPPTFPETRRPLPFVAKCW